MADNKSYKDGAGTSYTHGLEDLSTVFHTRIVGAAVDDTAATGSPVAMGAVYAVANPTVDANDVGYVGMSQYRGMYVQQIDSSGNLIDPSTVNEDALSTGGSSGIPALAVRRDSKTVRVGTDGDWANLSMNSVGDLRVDGGQSFTTTPVTLASNNALYADGDNVGVDMEVANCARASGAGGMLTGIKLTGSSAVAASEFAVYVFSQEPATGTYTNNGAMTLDTADARFCIGAWTLDQVDPEGFVTWKENINKAYTCNATSLWILVRSVGYAGTPAGATDFQVTLELIRD